MNEIEAQDKEPLNTETYQQGDWFYVGNSGLRLREYNQVFFFHYLPDNLMKSNADAFKYTLVYGKAIWEFLQWWQTQRQASPNFPTTLMGVSRSEFIDITRRLVGEALTVVQTGSAVDEQDVLIDLPKVVASPQLMSKIERLAEKCDKQGYLMKPVVHW